MHEKMINFYLMSEFSVKQGTKMWSKTVIGQ